MEEKNILKQNLTDVISERFARYAKYIIQDRALPDARDGLKPVQRRILYAMWEDGNTFEKQYRKSVKSVGLVIGNYHPHGESSVYDAMVRMSQSWKTRIPLIDMHGNNGSMDDDPAAAMRYTEARLSKLSSYLLSDIEKDTVLFSYNFDDTTTEPTVLPSRIPNLLINGISGIAAGYATNIPPHNLNEVIEAAMYRVQNPKCSLDELMQFVKGPDFPTGAIIQGLDGIKEAFETGKGRIVVRSKVEFEKGKTINQLIITQIPYEVVKSKLVQRIDEIRVAKTIDGMLDVRDESDRNGLKIVIDLKKEVDHELVLQYLYKHSDLQVYYNYNIVAIVDKAPKQIGLKEMLDSFIAHRKEVVYRSCSFDLKNAQNRMHIVMGLMKAVDVLDEIIAIIRSSKDKADSKKRLIEYFDFSDLQAEAIVTLRLYRLSNTDITKLEKEMDELENTIISLTEILENESRLNKEVISQLKEVNKEFEVKRLSVIENQVQEINISKEQLITKEQIMTTLSEDGYVKKVSLRSFAASDSKAVVKEGDRLVLSKEVHTLQKIIFFTKQGTYGYYNVYDLPDLKWKEIGNHMNTLIKMDSTEKINNAYVINQFNTYGYFVSITKKGMIKKTKISDFEVSRNNKTLTAISISEEDEVIKTLVAYDDSEIIIASKKGYVTRYPVDLITTVSCKSKGIKAMKIEEDEIVDAQIIMHDKNQIVFFNQKMQSKRMKLSEINITGRYVKGEMVFKPVKFSNINLQQMILGNIDDSVLLDNFDEILIKDIPIMNKQSGFSNQLSIDSKLKIFEEYSEIPLLSIPAELIRSEEMEYEIQGLEI